LRAYRDLAKYPVVSIRKNRYSTAFDAFITILSGIRENPAGPKNIFGPAEMGNVIKT